MNSFSQISKKEKMMIRNHLHSEFPIIQAVIENSQQGQIFRNINDSYWVLHKAGFSQVFIKNKSDESEFVDFVDKNAHLPKYFHIYAPPETLVNVFSFKGESFNVRVRERIQLRYQSNEAIRPLLNDEFRLNEVTLQNIDLLSIFNLDLSGKFWNDNGEFVKNALAVSIFDRQNNPVSLCYAASIGDKKAEIDVVTLDKFRGKGLAKAVVAFFILTCVKNTLIPNWDCFVDNEASLQTAKSLNFIQTKKYKFVSIFKK